MAKKEASEKTTEKPSVVFGVDLAKVDEVKLRAMAVELQIDGAADASVEALVGAMTAYQRKNTKKTDLANCDVCGGVSDVGLPACPYCGDSEIEPAPEPAPEPQTAVKTKAKPAKAKVQPAPEPEPQVEVAAQPAPEPEPQPEPKKPGRPKKAETTAIVKAVQAIELPEGVTAEKLDAAVAEVVRLKTQSAQDMWQLGAAILRIHDEQLWKARLTPDGKGVYRTFDQFCRVEVRMSHTACYQLMDVSKEFDAEQVSKFGTSKLSLVLQAPKEDRDELLKDVEAGTPHRQLKVKVDKAKEESGTKDQKRDTGRKPTPKGRPRAAEHLTIATVLGKHKVALFKKPAKKGAELTPAKGLEDQPFGFEDLGNGVKQFFFVTVNTKGELILSVERKREE